MFGHLSCFFFQDTGDPPDLHSFPTRRSSDLPVGVAEKRLPGDQGRGEGQALARPSPSRARITEQDRKSTRLNSSHRCISYAVFCLKKKNCQTVSQAQNRLNNIIKTLYTQINT